MNLDIYLAGRHIASTVPRSRGRRFTIEYSTSVLADMPAESILLSCSLPTPGPSGPGNARAFLEGLLPEGHALEVMASRVRGVQLDSSDGSPAEPADVLNLLAAYGRECAGAIVLVPTGQDMPGAGHYRELNDRQVAGLITNLPNNPLGSDLAAGIRMSLAGNQPKLLLARLGERWCEPVDGAATTHIIKPTGVWPLSADNEAIVMGVARAVGLTQSATWVEDFGGTRALVAERFDRIVDPVAQTVTRRHQEDMCQALGLRPREKYSIGRPSRRMATLLRAVPTAPGVDARKLFEQTVFRTIVGDEDGHGKNYGLIIDDGEVDLAPLYDALTTMVYPELSGKMGTPVGRQENLAKVDLDALIEEGRACGIPERTSREIAVSLADRITTAVHRLPENGLDGVALDAVSRTLTMRATRLMDGEPMGSPPAGSALSTGRGRAAGTLDSATTVHVKASTSRR